IFISFVNLLMSFKSGRKAPRNPWGATTLEWQAPTPPTKFNFPENEPPPTLYEIYDYSDLHYDPEIGGWYRGAERALGADPEVPATGEARPAATKDDSLRPADDDEDRRGEEEE